MPQFELTGAAERNGSPEIRDYDFHDFPGRNLEPIRVKGRFCSGNYTLRAGVKEPSQAEIVAHHRKVIDASGAKIVAQFNCLIVASLIKAGQETWMQAGCQGFGTEYSVFVVQKAALKSTLTPPSQGDFRLLGHMPGYTIVKREVDEQSELDFDVGPGVPPIKAQGRRQLLFYQSTGRPVPAGDLEVVENYLGAIRALGGDLLYQGDKDVTARFEDGGQVWVRVTSLFGEYALSIVEEKPVQTTKPNSDLKATLEKSGRAVLYINFDFAKASLKPDASPVIAQIVALLKANPSYRISVDGHTDNVGNADANKKLSEARAASVVDELVKNGIEKTRLSSAGFGAASPIADNESSAGRSKNRRVELVKR
jgi:outer membrane protein OmpA-like peptidoglycan-associated protein